MKPRSPSRLSWKLLLAILPPVALAVTLIVWLQYDFARREFLGSIDKEMRMLAQRTGENIDDLLEQRYRDLFTLSESPLIADYYRNVDFGLKDEAESYRRELERYLGNFAARSGDYAFIFYLDSKGGTVCRITSRAARGAALPAGVFSETARLREGEWLTSGVRDLEGAGPVLVFSKPVRDESGALKGALVLGYDLSQIRSLLASIEVGRQGRAYVRTSDGRVLEARGPLTGGGLLTAVSALKRRPWQVVLEAPLEDFLQPLRKVKNAAALTALLGLVALLVLLLWLVRSITRPIAELALAARRIGAGDLSHRVPRPGTDEIGTLGRAFNEMADNLEGNRKALIQAEKLSAIGQLISAVAHELNNPLAAISGYVQIALLDGAPPRLKDDLSHVYSNVLRCRKVVENLLLFVRQSRHERRRVSLNETVSSALELLEYRLVKTEDVSVLKELCPSEPRVAGDFQQIVQVLVNLVSNSCDAMEGVARYPEGKRLVIRTGTADGAAFLEIEDNGPGIDAGLREKVFQPFFTTKEAGKGTGLGLPICRQIVRDHGGTIEVGGKPGEGCVFRMVLPAVDEKALDADTLATPAAHEPVPGKRVLVADDEKDIAELIARLLREDGDEVDVAHTGLEALRLIDAASYDLVISDMEMESAKGMDIYARLVRDGRLAARLLFVTGDILNPKVLEFLAKTGCEYLAKPFDVHELRQAARRLLRER